jgi:hypothetical protein
LLLGAQEHINAPPIPDLLARPRLTAKPPLAGRRVGLRPRMISLPRHVLDPQPQSRRCFA